MGNEKTLKKFIVSITENEVPYHTTLVEARSKQEILNVVSKVDGRHAKSGEWCFVTIQAADESDTVKDLRAAVDEYYAIAEFEEEDVAEVDVFDEPTQKIAETTMNAIVSAGLALNP